MIPTTAWPPAGTFLSKFLVGVSHPLRRKARRGIAELGKHVGNAVEFLFQERAVVYRDKLRACVT